MGAFGSVAYGGEVGYYTHGSGSAVRSAGTGYYTGAPAASEPAGRWSGSGAAKLGLVGEVDPQAMTNLYERGLDPRDPEGLTRFGSGPRNYRSFREMVNEKLAAEPDALEERVREIVREANRSVRQSNVFADFTFSPSKDVTVQHTAAEWAERQAVLAGRPDEAETYRYIRETIEEACEAGNAAALAYLNKHAGYARSGRHGEGCTGTWVEAHDWTVATFFQHTSRDGDPQLHWHNPILLNTECADGKVRKIHTTLIQAHRQGAAAIGARVLQEQITAKLGWEFAMRADGNCYELTNVDQQAKNLFSERTRGISKQAQVDVAEFVAHHGRQPNALELTRIKQRATLTTRQAKSKVGETRDEQHARWDRELRAEVGAGMARQAALAGRTAPAPLPGTFSPSAVMAVAVARCQETQSTWGRSELTAEMVNALPPFLGLPDPARVTDLVESMVDVTLASDRVVQITNTGAGGAMPSALTLDNGQSAYVQPGSTRYASREHVAAEYALQRAATVRGRSAVAGAAVDRWIQARGEMGLGVDQAAALRGIATSGAAVSVLVGPAGTGKSYVLGALSQAWSDLGGGRVVGLATSEQATDVLRAEGVAAKNISQWLAAQDRIGRGKPFRDDASWAVRPGDIVVPDEASMADTAQLARIRDYVDRAGARLLLTGDPRQLAAVGAGGAMALLADSGAADVHTLAEVRRFTNDWEGPASLQLRAGKVEVLDTYDAHGRLIDAGTAEQAARSAARAYVGDRLAGKSSVVVTPTNAMAAQVNAMVRDALVDVGRVNAEGVLLARDGNTAGVGDLVKCRQNDWTAGVKNQGRYLLVGVGEDGSLRLRDEGGEREVTVSAAYRDEWVELGYAGTVHSVQGGTYDTSHPIISGDMPVEALYPAMTRGRERNTARIITRAENDQEETGQTHERAPRDGAAVMADIIERSSENAKAALAAEREDAERARSMRAVTGMVENGTRIVVRERTAGWLDQLAAEGRLSAEDRQRLASDQGTEQLGRLLRSVEQAGHDPEAALRAAVESRSLTDARSPAQVLYARVTSTYRGQLAPDLDATHGSHLPAGTPAEFEQHLNELADLARARQAELGSQAAEDQPLWAVETLGPVPEDVVDRAEWEHRAGIIAGHREATGWDDEAEALGPAPGLSATEQRRGWYEAWQAAGRPDATAEETVLSEGALRCRVQAMEREAAWLPPSQHEAMRATELQLAGHQQDAALLAARAEMVADDAERAALLEQVADMEAMAARLEAKRAELQMVADERLNAIAEQAVTRDLGQRARAELAQRGVPVDQEPDRVTAEEWLAAERVARVEDDQHRPVTEADVAEAGTTDAQHVAHLAADDQERAHGRDLAADDQDHGTDLPAPEQERAHGRDLPAEDRQHTADLPAEEQIDTPSTASNDAVEQPSSRPVTESPNAAELEDEPEMPAGVPSRAQVDAAVAAARYAAEEIADRVSAEEAAREAESSRIAEEIVAEQTATADQAEDVMVD